MPIILASGSPRRKELMALITPEYTVTTSEVDERALRADTPALLAGVLAQAKCAAVAALCPDGMVVGCDTVVDVDGTVYGKPEDKADARRMMHVLSGRTHLVHTGVCIEGPRGRRCFTDTTRVTFAPLSEEEIEAYISTDEPYDKAGGYGVQGAAAKFVTHIDGCYFNILGFPVPRVYAALKELDAL